LLNKGYEVHGVIRRSSTFTTRRIDHLYVDPHEPGAKLLPHYGDLLDGPRLYALLAELQPDEIYHLAAQSHVRVSYGEPEYTCDTTGLGTVRLLEAIRQLGLECRFYQASSSEMFGSSLPAQDENTSLHPSSPYGVSTLSAYWTARTTARHTESSPSTG
jgi:GDPmannose 4,6-dehydratase